MARTRLSCIGTKGIPERRGTRMAKDIWRSRPRASITRWPTCPATLCRTSWRTSQPSADTSTTRPCSGILSTARSPPMHSRHGPVDSSVPYEPSWKTPPGDNALAPPVVARRREDVELHRVLEREGSVEHIRWDVEDLAAADDDALLLVWADPELQLAVQHVRQLFVVMPVHFDDASAAPEGARERDAIPGDDLPAQIGRFDVRDVVPSV